MPVSLRFIGLAGASLIAAPIPAIAQETAVSAAAGAAQEPAKTVEGATPDRVALVNACGGHKFETMVEVDAVTHRASRVKLCSKPGASDADWVKTLQSAIEQIEQRDMPPEARDKVIAELKAEIGNYANLGSGGSTVVLGSPTVNLGKNLLAESILEPEAPFKTSILPPLPAPRGKAGASGPASAAIKPIRATLSCLERGESGRGGSCDFLDRGTILAITAITPLAPGARIRFLRGSDEFERVEIGAMRVGQTRRISIPGAVCDEFSRRVVLELQAPDTSAPGVKFGPFDMRC